MIKRNIVIVGGGSSGWMAAAYLQKALNVDGLPNKVQITLVESPDIPTISVGEATIPSIRHLLSVIDVDELEFIKKTDATFKQSIKYVNWEFNDNSFYHHPFSRVRKSPLDKSASEWLASNQKIPFMETCSEQPIICEMGLAPVMQQRWDMGAPLTYAYHMNAAKFADYMRDISVPRGVKHILANVTDVNLQNENKISSVNTDQGHTLKADLFIDCTGFRAKLIEESLKVGFEDCSQWLLCDRATTMHVPYESHYPGMVRPYTTATALSNGWIWDIPLNNKRSIGYVHSSQFISQEDADKEMRAYQGTNCDHLVSRTIHFKVGHRKKHWHGNCIALGLSGGFIEPLESTGLYLSDLGSVLLAEYFPYKDEHMEAMAYRYNRLMKNRFYEVLDFINMHYCLTKRNDTEFWRTVQKPEHITDRLKAKFAYWKAKSPTASDFDDQSFLNQKEQEIKPSMTTDNRTPVDTAALWNHESYECIIYGMHALGSDNMTFNDHKPNLQVHPYIINRLTTAQQKLPLHDVWLKNMSGMKEYPTAIKPQGWRS